jgi:dynein heavy chain 2
LAKTVDYDDNFRLYLTSQNTADRFPTFIEAYITKINFTVTKDGLAEQLLDIILNDENPGLENQRENIIRENDQLRQQLNQLEDALLRELAGASGDILSNQSLLASLMNLKEKSTTIKTSLSVSKKLQTEINDYRSRFAPLAFHGSSIYFSIKNLSRLNHMYRVGLPIFFIWFQNAIKLERDSGREIKSLQYIEEYIFVQVCRCLFKQDRYVFALNYIHDLHHKKFERKEWEFFLGKSADTDGTDEGSIPDWLPEKKRKSYTSLKVSCKKFKYWRKIIYLGNFPSFYPFN